MNKLSLLVFFVFLGPTAALAAPAADLARAPLCHQCSMDRDKFGHSRMVIEFEDGSTVASCSLHCAAVELAVSIDRIPVRVSVADYNSRALIDVEEAVWVLGGSRKGVMTARAKWAFLDRNAAEKFTQAHGGGIVTFDEALKSAYEEMYQDTKAIREFRKMMRPKLEQGAKAQ